MTTATTRPVTVLSTLVEIGPRQYANVEYPYECSCGETYREAEYAAACRKCRVYSLGGRCLYVTDIRSVDIVWGRLPTAEEEVEYIAEMEREEEETRDFIAMCQKEGPRYERIMAEQTAATAVVARELLVDQMYDIQDQLMGY